MTRKPAPPPRPGPHPRNRHQDRYDLPALTAACPALAPFVRPGPAGVPTLDFGDPQAVRSLNRALLALQYGVRGWDLPEGYLCPPIPGRADHLHHLADLLAGPGGTPPRGPSVRVLDLGTGASLVYPLVGHLEYGWSFVGTDIDAGALASAEAILAANPACGPAIRLRRQGDPARIFEGVVEPGETFDLCMSNPPFHASAAEAGEATRRKWQNLGRDPGTGLNFGGRGAELWCEGGEVAFVTRMVEESALRPGLCRWFSALLSRAASLPAIRSVLHAHGLHGPRVRILEMGQGQKRSRIVAWTFRDPADFKVPGPGPDER
jgi:23S rRNA (adenine1618-N6)-methyltransferase